MQFGSTLQISTNADVSLLVWFAAQGFTFPTTPPDITYDSSLSITSVTGTGTVGLTSCVDASNGLAPPTGLFCSAPTATLTNANETYLGASSNSNTVSTVISSLTTTPYTLSQVLKLNLSAGSNLNVVTSQILTPIPEPMSITLFGGVALLAARLIRRKVSH